ncbi:MAG: ArsR/SmtB family transcription factor [Solirubrobacterales bacterium]
MDKDYDKYYDIAETLKVLAHPVRICIVKGLIENGDRNVTSMQTCLDTPQSTTSQHLQKLKAAGIVEGKRHGTEIKYRVCNEKVVDIIKTLFNENNNS